ncbi:hypothetical protein LJC49_05085 [Ruminococcaceae bacterium OttesenSCG-928-I18]|nr:hypothetical protein [Ruminococcaceae bacterium OttesenSCG-928-I18]
MKCDIGLDSLNNLHSSLAELLEKKKMNIKSACYLSELDIDAEQLWVLRFYHENGALPTIKQAKAIWETCKQKRLTLKAFRKIMDTSLIPQKLVFNYSDIAPFFDKGCPPEDMKRDVLKVLSNWKNNTK